MCSLCVSCLYINFFIYINTKDWIQAIVSRRVIFSISLNNCGVLIRFVVVVIQLAAVVHLGLLWPFIQLFLALVYTVFVRVLFDLPFVDCWFSGEVCVCVLVNPSP